MYLITIWEEDSEVDLYASNFTKEEAEKYAEKFNELAEQKRLTVKAVASLASDQPPPTEKLIELHSNKRNSKEN